jgi:hypothetical protein
LKNIQTGQKFKITKTMKTVENFSNWKDRLKPAKKNKQVKKKAHTYLKPNGLAHHTSPRGHAGIVVIPI